MSSRRTSLTSTPHSIVAFRGREEKLDAFFSLFPQLLTGTILDIGCAGRHLSQVAPGRYWGLDILGRPDVIGDLDAGIPFESRSIDTVLAFDVLEHVDKIHTAFDDLCRVSRAYIVVAMPNMYEWRFRLMYLLGRAPSGKYGLPVVAPSDRHRWLPALSEIRSFVATRGEANSFELVHECYGYYRYKRLVARMFTALGRSLFPRFTHLFSYHYWAILKRSDTVNS